MLSRCTPAQKALVVRGLQKHLRKVTLAVGDGVNDIPMIEAASVAIGIFGQEGKSAANAADIGIYKFSDLRPIVIVHGAWNYIRMIKMVLFLIYKNLMLVFVLLLLIVDNELIPFVAIDRHSLMLNNLLFTTLPILPLAFISKRETYNNRLKLSYLYRYSSLNMGFTGAAFARWTLLGLYHACAIVIIGLCTMPQMSRFLFQGCQLGPIQAKL